jgi:TPR repeat protein
VLRAADGTQNEDSAVELGVDHGRVHRQKQREAVFLFCDIGVDLDTGTNARLSLLTEVNSLFEALTMKPARDASLPNGVVPNQLTARANSNPAQAPTSPPPQPILRSKTAAPNGMPVSDQNGAQMPTNLPQQPILRPAGEAFQGMLKPGETRVNADRDAALLLFKLADAGDAEAQCELGFLYAKGRGVERSMETALAWLGKSAEQGNMLALSNLHLAYSEGMGVTKDLAKAMEYLHACADPGDEVAQYRLGVAYSSGHGVPKNLETAVAWFKKSADQGHAVAQSDVGLAYWTGQGVPQNLETAVDWYKKSADQGNAVAQRNLGVAYWTGQGVPQNLETAVDWYKKSADQGNAMAQSSLGFAYWTGQGVPKNLEAAVELYKKSADQGDAVAQINLGLAYWHGHGVPKNLEAAVEWVKKSADQGDAKAQISLGVAYASGQGVPKNLETAVDWYKKSADQGNTKAQIQLGTAYWTGQGIPKNLETGVEYFFQSASATGKLDLSSIIASDELVIAITQTLKSNNTVTSLIINKASQITDAGAKAIAQALELNTSLRELPDYETWVKNEQAKLFIGLHLNKNRQFADTVKNYRDHPVTTTQGFPPELIGLLEEAVFRTFQKTLKVDYTPERASGVVDEMSHILATERDIEIKTT